MSTNKRYDEFFLAKKHAHIRPSGFNSDAVGGVRIYGNSPSDIVLQIRTIGSITRTGRGKIRKMYAHVCLERDDINAVINVLTNLRAELKG